MAAGQLARRNEEAMKNLLWGVPSILALVIALSGAAGPRTERRAEAAGLAVDRVLADQISCLPHLGAGQGLSSDIVLTNPSASEVLTGSVEFRDDEGLEQEFEIVGLGPRGSVDFTIQPLGSVTFRTDGTGELVTGSAVIHAGMEPGAVVRFRIPEIGIAGIGTSVPAQALAVPVRKRNDGLNSGIAFSNPSEWPVALNLILSDSEGRKVATGDSFVLPAGGHLARFFNELFSTVTATEFEGTAAVEVRYSREVAATALELGPAPGQFTALPVVARRDRGWSLSNSPAYSFTSIVATSTDPPVYYAGTWGFGVLKSTDGGESWHQVNAGLWLQKISALAADPNNPETIYAGTLGGLFKSSNGGASWTLVFDKGGAQSILINPGTPSTIQVGGILEEGLYRSLNGGNTWAKVGSGESIHDVRALAADPQVPTTLYAGVGESPYFYKSVDGGTTWTATGNGLEGSIACIAIDPHNSSIIYAGSGWVFKSLDGGATFKKIVAGLTSTTYRSLAIASDDSQTLYVGTGDGVFKTVNGGSLWEPIGLDDIEVPGILEDPQRSGTFVAATLQGVAILREGDRQLRIPHFGNGGGLSSDFVLSNPSWIESVSGRLEFFDDQGLPLVTGIEGLGRISSTQFAIPARSTVTFSTDGLGDLTAGSALVTTDNPCGGSALFEIIGIGIAGVGEAQPSDRVILPSRTAANGISTGFAVQNAGDDTVVLAITLRTAGGQILGETSSSEILPRGHFAGFVDELFPDLDLDGREGTLTIDAGGGQIAAIALELGKNPGEFTTLPVTAVR